MMGIDTIVVILLGLATILLLSHSILQVARMAYYYAVPLALLAALILFFNDTILGHGYLTPWLLLGGFLGGVLNLMISSRR
jgi:hypothetical protein